MKHDPIHVEEITEITILSNESGKRDFGQERKLESVNAFMPPGEDEKWRERTNMPTAKSSHSSSTVNGKIYAIVGSDGENFNLATIVEAYDPA